MIFDPNKCNCTVNQFSEVAPCLTTSTSECCLVICDVLTGKDIIPCADPGTLDLTPYITIPSCCTATDIEVKIPYYSNNLTDVTFVRVVGTPDTYTLEYTSNWEEGKDFKTASVVYEVSCGLLKVQATVTIPFLNENYLNCDGTYDPCTQVCTPFDPEISLSGEPFTPLANEIKLI